MKVVAPKQGLSFFHVSGEPYEIGYRLGEIARPVFAGYMEQSSAWRALRRWRGEPFVQMLRDAARMHCPALLAGLDGMAAGLASPSQPAALLDVLKDRAPPGLPIYRDDPLDPDDENTLATALFDIGDAGMAMQVHRQGQCEFDTFIARSA